VCCLEMTTKRKIIGRLVPCRCFRGEEEIVSVLDYSHCGLQQVPKEVFNFERTLEELYLDANQIEELPKVIHVLLGCEGEALSLNVCPALGRALILAGVVEKGRAGDSRDIPCNWCWIGRRIQDFPENIKCCKCLTIIEASVNPVSK
ncbi:LRRC7 protein, partial [Menura novaehollandiae]|nr:LRRC7 protein [Menura novaehollandiae]